MIAAKKWSTKSSGKCNAEMFDDVPVLQRKWQAALRPGAGLPRYEDVMLGSLGRLADHIVLLKNTDGVLEVSRTGRYAQKWLGDERWDIPLTALSPDCATALGEAAASALANSRPYLAVAHCVRDGLVRTYDILALPTSSRWGGTLIGTCWSLVRKPAKAMLAWNGPIVFGFDSSSKIVWTLLPELGTKSSTLASTSVRGPAPSAGTL